MVTQVCIFTGVPMVTAAVFTLFLCTGNLASPHGPQISSSKAGREMASGWLLDGHPGKLQIGCLAFRRVWLRPSKPAGGRGVSVSVRHKQPDPSA